MSRSGMLTALAAVVVASSSGLAASGASGAPTACRAGQLSARMAVIVGSAGAGNIEYRLLLRNASRASCVVSGHPGLRLRGAAGQNLPTHVTPVPPNAIGVIVTLVPGGSAQATLRFSPDVPGPGEGMVGACEKTAHTVRVTLASPGQGSLIGPITPPTAVCEHGGMTETNLSRA